ncbi:MAG: hypothetical protein JWO38_7579 [Gemmataceae bacterium]|nr:hypothetical protein [Gemmataceae bacterium]
MDLTSTRSGQFLTIPADPNRMGHQTFERSSSELELLFATGEVGRRLPGESP